MSVYRHYDRVSVGGLTGLLAVSLEGIFWIVAMTLAVAVAALCWLVGVAIYGLCVALLRLSGGDRGREWIRVGRALMRQPRQLASAR